MSLDFILVLRYTTDSQF